MVSPHKERGGDSYEIEEYKGTKGADIWLDVPASYYLGAVVFFARKGANCYGLQGDL